MGVFKPVKHKQTGQTWAPELVPGGCDCFTGEGGVWEEKVAKIQLEREAAGSEWAQSFLQSRVKNPPELEPTFPACPLHSCLSYGVAGLCVGDSLRLPCPPLGVD